MFTKTAISSGAGAALASLCAIGAAALYERKSPIRPVNATSHVAWGDRAGRTSEADLPHTALGLAINVGAGFFWGSVMAGRREMSREQSVPAVLADAAAVGTVAAIVDYGLVPKRLTPGWELVLSKRSVAASMAAMALGLAAGAIVAETSRPDRSRSAP